MQYLHLLNQMFIFVPMEYPMTVVKNTGSWYVVKTPDGSLLNCKVKGSFRLKGLRTANPVAVGDRVAVQPNADGTAFITAIQPRRNYIIRRASNLSKESHILAANIDMAAIVVTLVHPVTSTVFIDRFLATAEAYRVRTLIIFNKIDLLESDENHDLLNAVTSLYDSIGYDTVHISARRGDGMDSLRDMLKGKITLVSGNSGVGKSTIINDLIPGGNQKTAIISDAHDQGMHTTTFSEMFELPGSGAIIDTPGIRGFGTIEMDEHEVSHYFPDIFEIGRDCRFGNCTHTHEPHCAVLKAVEESRIAQSRYNSYLSILDDVSPDKYRKPF